MLRLDPLPSKEPALNPTLVDDPSWSLTPEWLSNDMPTSLDWVADPQVLVFEDIVNASTTIFQPEDDYITIGAIYHERVRFAARHLKKYPGLFYKRGQAPFIHRHSYVEYVSPVVQDS